MMWLQRVNPMRRIKPWLYLLGITLVMGMLVGADALTTGRGGEKTKSEPPKAIVGRLVGPVVMGTVDTNPQPVHYGGLPPVLSSGTISKVHVKDGDEVKAGDTLYEFDTTSLTPALELAQRSVEAAEIKVTEAVEKLALQNIQIENAEKMIPDAEDIEKRATRYIELVRKNLEKLYKVNGTAKEEWESTLNNEPAFFDAQSKLSKAQTELKAKRIELSTLRESLKLAAIMVNEAKAGLNQAKAQVDNAQNAINLCTIKAKIGGTVEQVSISPGVTLGISSVKPALWLIPAGPRIVRGEIEAEFAHRITPALIGKEVIIYDNTNPKLTYKGRVKYVSGTFLLKRSSEGPLGSDTRVLEALVEVTESQQPDKAPLRVGQRVRIDLGD